MTIGQPKIRPTERDEAVSVPNHLQSCSRTLCRSPGTWLTIYHGTSYAPPFGRLKREMELLMEDTWDTVNGKKASPIFDIYLGTGTLAFRIPCDRKHASDR